MKELKIFLLKTATRRMKAGRTGAEAQRRRQNGSARGEKKGREKKGKEAGNREGGLRTTSSAQCCGRKRGRKKERRKEREGRGLKKGKGGEDRKKKREKERAESGGLSRELA